MESEPSSTPKLSLYSFPSHTPEPAGMLTPPLRTTASVPFVWEEAPGKPRNCDSNKRSTVRCLDLPPRLLSEVKVTSLPSPTTVLDGPDAGRSATFSFSFREFQRSFSKPSSPEKREKDRFVGFWSRKRGLKMKGLGRENSLEGSAYGFSDVDGEVDQNKVKITRIRRNGSFLNISNTTNHLWATIYGSFKQVVPWSRRAKRLNKDRWVM